MAVGRFFDGESGRRLDVDLSLDRAAETLKIEHPELPHGSQYWPLHAIRALRDHARDDQMVLSLRADSSLDSDLIVTARLTLSDPAMISELRSRAPNLERREVPPGTSRKIVVRAIAGVGAILLMLFVILPGLADRLAPLIPIEREVAYGKTVVRQMERMLGAREAGQLICRENAGQAALETMVGRLANDAGLEYDLDIRVFDHQMVNAFAAPGGQIVVMRGLIDKAESPDEVAAVLAHEIGHVEARDVTRNALRSAGSAGLLSLILGDFMGGTLVVAGAEFMLNASYTRDAEEEADEFALDMLDAAQISTEGMAKFFDRLTELERQLPELPVYMRSHPATEGRADRAIEFARAQGYTRDVLAEKDWRALKGICG